MEAGAVNTVHVMPLGYLPVLTSCNAGSYILITHGVRDDLPLYQRTRHTET